MSAVRAKSYTLDGPGAGLKWTIVETVVREVATCDARADAALLMSFLETAAKKEVRPAAERERDERVRSVG